MIKVCMLREHLQIGFGMLNVIMMLSSDPPSRYKSNLLTKEALLENKA